MMPISQSDLMPISSERSDARLPQCELVIGIRQGFLRVGLFFIGLAPVVKRLKAAIGWLIDFWGGGSPKGDRLSPKIAGPGGLDSRDSLVKLPSEALG